MHSLPSLTPDELDQYAWQLDVSGFGITGQQRLKNASVLITRCGGLGGVVALHLTTAGVGRLILAHGGEIKPSDLNRQLLMTHAGIGTSRIKSILTKLSDLNPHIHLEPHPENVSPANAASLVQKADLVVDCAPLFEERYALNTEIVKQGKPMIECAVYGLEAHITFILPGQTPCLRCLYPEPSTEWKRRFPVFGAVSGMVGSLAAMEAIKYLAGFGTLLTRKLLVIDLQTLTFKTFPIRPDPACPECHHLFPSENKLSPQ